MVDVLVSLYVIAYNHERYIREAVQGALSQTWSPLEIILSDDCSDDSTYSIMEQIAAEYSGPHTVVLNRNKKRLGVGAHINAILSIASGSWIVASAGDDVSSATRVERLYRHWEKYGGRHDLIFSNLTETDESGKAEAERDFRQEVPGGWVGEDLEWGLRVRLSGACPQVHGAAVGYPRRVFDMFGPLADGVVFEDGVLSWRAEMGGGVSLCPLSLVEHRNHCGQLTNVHSKQALLGAGQRRRMLAWSRVVLRKQNVQDAHIAYDRGLIGERDFVDAVGAATAWLRREERDFSLFWGSWAVRWRGLVCEFPRLLRTCSFSEMIFVAVPRPLYLWALKRLASRR